MIRRGWRRRSRIVHRPRRRHPQPVADLIEWLDKQYLPAYYVGGKMPPYLFGRRPNLFGVSLLIEGSLALLLLAPYPASAVVSHGLSALQGVDPVLALGDALIVFVFPVLLVASGVSLLVPRSESPRPLRGQPARRTRPRRAGSQSA